jgi:hypothetical protein
VERRRAPRSKISKQVTLKVLDRMSGPSLGKSMEGRVTDVSGSGMRLRLPLPVPAGAPVEIRDRKLLILGEVSRCVPDGDAYAAGIRVTEMLSAPVDRRVDQSEERRRAPVPTRS